MAFSLQLPPASLTATFTGQPVPQSATRQTSGEGGWTSVWSQDRPDAGASLLALSETHVFLAGPTTPLEARNLESGALVWQHSVTTWSDLTAASALVLGVSGEHAYALDGASGRTRWVTMTTGTNTRLVVDDGYLLMASDTDLLLRDLGTGTAVWRVGLTAAPSAPVTMVGDTIVAATSDGLVTALERASGAPRWQVKIPSTAQAIAVDTTSVYVSSANGTLCGYATRSGSERWCFALRTPFSGAPLIDGNRVRVTLFDNSLRSFDQGSGSMEQPLSLGHRPSAGPWKSGAAIVVVLTTGELLIIGQRGPRILSRLEVPGSSGQHVLAGAAISTDHTAVASLTVATSGEHHLTVYRDQPSRALPILGEWPTLPIQPVPLPLPDVTPEDRPAVLRPFPSSR